MAQKPDVLQINNKSENIVYIQVNFFNKIKSYLCIGIIYSGIGK